MSLKTLLKICSTLASGFAIVALAASLAATGAAAASRDRQHTAAAHHRIHHAYAAHRRHRFARRYPPPYDAGGIPPGAIVGPGYVFVPGLGILGEDCDMPTSTCTNEYRDVQ